MCICTIRWVWTVTVLWLILVCNVAGEVIACGEVKEEAHVKTLVGVLASGSWLL